MELFSTDSHFILVNGNKSLCINRRTSQFYSKIGSAKEERGSRASCLGIVHGFMGKVQFAKNCSPRLVFIRERYVVGKLKGYDVYKIKGVVAIPMEGDEELALEPCNCNSHVSKRDENVTGKAGAVKVRPTTLTSQPESNQNSLKKNEKDDKVERRMLEEFYKMFSESDSFYYSNDYDLTNSIQRQTLRADKLKDQEKLPLWYGADPRFFWNQYMLSGLIQNKESIEPCWIIPVIQGFVQHQRCTMDHLFDPVGPGIINIHGSLDIWLISRRSRYRAGTRYLKRGIDDSGNVANYVETEQIMVFKKHIISFVLIRGSVPLYWSQPGVRYRPPLRLERSNEDNYAAFRNHIEDLGTIYGPIVIINLMDKSGKEKVLGDAFLENVLRHNSPELSYYTFDFHENCRGMHFENVKILIEKLDDKVKAMNYCWVDSYGIVQTQTGVCRVNCVDCLDRTNVVQSAIARHVLCGQMCKLGLVSPEFGLPNVLRKCLQNLWANNGDTISKQYAGTSALKGDYTRTGERRIAGALKDGVNSANRYYLNRFRDSTRQVVIDILLGKKKYVVSEDEFENEKSVDDKESTAEQLKAVMEDTIKCVVPKFDVVLGSWGLINAKENDTSAVDVDTIVILTETAYYVTGYDCMLDSIATTEKVKLTAVISIELGFEVLNPSPGLLGMFTSSSHIKPSNQVPSLRITYMTSGAKRYHQFRSSNMRFFNNVCVPLQQPDEMTHCLSVIGDTFQIGTTMQGNPVAVKSVGRIVNLPTRAESRDSTSSVGTGSTSWAQRYLNFNQSEELSQKASQRNMKMERSFEKFTPRYFRRSAAADEARREEAATSSDGPNIIDIKVEQDEARSTNITSTISSMPQDSIKLDLIVPKLIIPQGFQSTRDMDLVLPSCGLIIVPAVTLERPGYPFSPSFLCQYSTGLADSTEPSVFPVALKVGQQPKDSNDLPGSDRLSYISSLQAPRYSLPTSSLTPTLSPRVGGQTPVTPEITLTEPRRFEGGYLNPIAAPLRLCKSTEDVKLMNPDIVSASSFLHGPVLMGSNLRPICTETGRSTSDQDISASLANSLKGAHSESSIKGAEPAQRFAHTRGNMQFKKEAVLAPLGKLANYFHPKKIKDSFKLQRKDVDVSNAEDPEKNRLLEERKQNCKSLIVDL